MRRKALHVRLNAHEPSVIELTVGDRVQVDRVVTADQRTVAERRGLIGPGTATLALEPGAYCFRTLSDASLRVVAGGVAASAQEDGKDPWPDPVLAPGLLTASGGDDLPGETPRFTVE